MRYEIKEMLVTYAIMVARVMLLQPLKGVLGHHRDVQGPRVVGLTESWIQLGIHTNLLGAGEELGLEIREAQIVEDRVGLDIASEGVWFELHRHFDEGHGEGNPMLRLFGGHDSRGSPKFDATGTVLLAGEEVPCSILVRTNEVDDVVMGSIVDIVKGSLVSTPGTVCIQWKSNGDGLVDVALAEAKNSILPGRRCALGRS